MNRQERRRLEKKNDKTVVLQQYREEAFEEGRKTGMHDVLEITFYMVAYTLQYKLGFGRKRLQWIMQAIYNNIDAYRTEHLTPEDFQTIIEDMRQNYGIKLN